MSRILIIEADAKLQTQWLSSLGVGYTSCIVAGDIVAAREAFASHKDDIAVILITDLLPTSQYVQSDQTPRPNTVALITEFRRAGYTGLMIACYQDGQTSPLFGSMGVDYSLRPTEVGLASIKQLEQRHLTHRGLFAS